MAHNKLAGKGIYVWILRRAEGGDMEALVRRLKEAGMTHVIPKLADGVFADLNGNLNYMKNLVNACHREGIRVIPYHFVYGLNPSGEASRIITELRKFPFDGLVINAEASYKQLSNAANSARVYSDMVKSAHPDLMLALSTYRYPSLHRPFPFQTFMTYVDINMPQVYWLGTTGQTRYQLERCIKEYRLFPDKPMIPTGAAYREHGMRPTTGDVRQFPKDVADMGLTGYNWWEYYHAYELMPELGDIITKADAPHEPLPPVTQPEPEPIGQFWAECTAAYALTIRSTPEFYADNRNVVGYLLAGERRIVYETSGIWWRIGHDEWVSSNFMRRVGDPITPQPGEKDLDWLLEIHTTKLSEHP